MKKLFGKFRYGEKGFTLIELLVVVAILGVLAAVAVPNIGKFIGKGKNEAKETELHNIQTAVMAMMADSTLGYLDGGDAAAPFTDIVNDDIVDMDEVTATSGNATLVLSSYMTGLDPDTHETKVQGITYDFLEDGTVIQNNP